jgi:hypothetical protein
VRNEELVNYRSCAFAVDLSGSDHSQKIGTQDVIDLINTSIEKFAWDGRVGSLGYMYCEPELTKWFLYTP